MAQEENGQVNPQLQEPRGLGRLIGLLVGVILLALGAGVWFLSERFWIAVASEDVGFETAVLEQDFTDRYVRARGLKEPQARRAALDALQRSMSLAIAEDYEGCEALMKREAFMSADTLERVVASKRDLDELRSHVLELCDEAREKGSRTERGPASEGDLGGR